MGAARGAAGHGRRAAAHHRGARTQGRGRAVRAATGASWSTSSAHRASATRACGCTSPPACPMSAGPTRTTKRPIWWCGGSPLDEAVRMALQRRDRQRHRGERDSRRTRRRRRLRLVAARRRAWVDKPTAFAPAEGTAHDDIPRLVGARRPTAGLPRPPDDRARRRRQHVELLPARSAALRRAPHPARHRRPGQGHRDRRERLPGGAAPRRRRRRARRRCRRCRRRAR